MYSIKYILRKCSGEKRPIRCRVSIPQCRIDLSVGISVLPSEWDYAAQRVNRTCKNYLIYNKLLSDIYNNIDGYITQCFIKHEPISTNDIKAIFNNNYAITPSNSASFDAVITSFIAEKSIDNSWSNKNILKWNTLRNYINEWKPNLQINDITDNFMRSYMETLIDRGQHNTTILRSVQYFREFLTWANVQGYYAGRSHLTFRPKLKGLNVKEVVYLEWEELMQLINYKCKRPIEQEIVDVFVFCCFTGLRYSDVKELRPEDVRNDKIHIVTRKTSDIIEIELNDYSRAIFSKYIGRLPVHSSQHCNRILQKVARECDINDRVRVVYYSGNQRHDEIIPKWQLITNHCARRTFVVNAMRLGIPSEVIMRWTGHKKFESMKPYLKIVNKLKEANMNKFNVPNVSQERAD